MLIFYIKKSKKNLQNLKWLFRKVMFSTYVIIRQKKLLEKALELTSSMNEVGNVPIQWDD